MYLHMDMDLSYLASIRVLLLGGLSTRTLTLFPVHLINGTPVRPYAGWSYFAFEPAPLFAPRLRLQRYSYLCEQRLQASLTN